MKTLLIKELTKTIDNLKDEIEELKTEDKLNVEGLARLLRKRQKTIKLNLELESENIKLKKENDIIKERLISMTNYLKKIENNVPRTYK